MILFGKYTQHNYLFLLLGDEQSARCLHSTGPSGEGLLGQPRTESVHDSEIQLGNLSGQQI